MTNPYRGNRLESLLREELNNLIERNFESPVGSLVTVTIIDIAQSGQNARVGVSVLPAKFADGVIKNLKKFEPELHHDLIRKMNIRTVPRLDFYLDTGADNAETVEKIIRENKEEFDEERK